jgi:hypothetical protein
LNADEPGDLKVLFKEIENVNGLSQVIVDFESLAQELIRVDVRAEERNKVEEDPDATELRQIVSNKMGQLPDVQKETIRQVLICGELNNLAVRTLSQNSGQNMEKFWVLDALARETGFLTQTYRAPNLNDQELNAFKTNEKLKPHIREYFSKRY